jgi:hypothetical protein
MFDELKRLTLSLLVATAAAGVAVVPAAAKEGVKATLATKIPLDAKPGSRLRVAWKLIYAEGDNRGQPFGANGVFVRLRSASGARAETAFAPTADHADGEYAATVAVPKGGIGDVEIGLRGFTSGAAGTHTSDMLFPITNDPLPGSLRAASGSDDSGSGSAAWLFGAVAASLLGMGAVGVAFARRRRASHA